MKRIVLIDSEKCIGCGACVKICPKKILVIDEKIGKCKVTNQFLCSRNGCCEKVCPTGAIKVKKNLN